MKIKTAISLFSTVAATVALAAVSDAEANYSTAMNRTSTAPTYSRPVADGVRVLFIGNSITLHGPAPSIGWTNNWGMAASARERDFVHLVTAGIERETGRTADLRVRTLVDFERHFETYDFSRADDLVSFRPDYLVVALGENVRPLTNDSDRVAFRTAFKRLLTRFTYDRMKPNVAVRGAFWPNPERDALMAHAASDLAMPFVAAPSPDDSHKAIGQFAHCGVASHPGDKGMAAIASAVLETLFPKRSGFEAWVDGRKAEVRPIRVSRQPFNQWATGYQRPVDQTEVAGMLRFETDGATELRVRADRTFKTALVRPLSANVTATVAGGEVRFTLPRPDFYVLELDGLHRPLEIFAQPKRDFAQERREANVVFGPGLHEPVVVKLRSHDRVYLDKDAVVMGSFQADGVEDVKVSGYGIICGSRNRRAGNACYREGMDGAVRIIDSKNIVFDGPTVLDSCCWCVSAFNSSDLELANLKVTGAWRYNTDGIDICNSRRVWVHDCFVHSFDDSLVVKGISHDYVASKKVLTTDFPRHEPVENIAFSNCVCWCGWGRTLEIGFETWARHMRGIVFEDCDLIHNAGVALSVHLGGPSVVEDATYRNIRIECDGSEEGGIVQTNREQRADCSPGNLIAWLCVENKKMFDGGGYESTHDFSKEPHGTIRHLTVENVSIRRTNGAPEPVKHITPEPGTSFGTISISNVTMDGVPNPLRVVLTFDDSLKDDLLIAAPELEKRGWRGTFNIVTDWVGKNEKYLTWDDVRELVRRGHEVTTHTISHPNLVKLLQNGNTNEVRRQLSISRDLIAGKTGFAPRYMCAPGVAQNDATERLCREAGLRQMDVPRHNFGAGNFGSVGEVVSNAVICGSRRLDLLHHGVSADDHGGWSPFPDRASFVRHLDRIAAMEQQGVLKVTDYDGCASDCALRAAAWPRHGVVALSFDDRYLEDWERAFPLFEKYGAATTFCIYGPMDATAVTFARKALACGHEIALHGVEHRNADKAVAEMGETAYWAAEVAPQLAACRAADIPVYSFAYPNCRHDAASDALFVRHGFTRLRGTIPGVLSPNQYDPKGEKLNKWHPIAGADPFFVPAVGYLTETNISNVILGPSYHTDIEDVLRSMDRAGARGERLSLVSHGISPTPNGISVKTEWLERILAAANAAGVVVRGLR